MAIRNWLSGAPTDDIIEARFEAPPIATIPKPARNAADPAPARALDPVAIMTQVTKVIERYVADAKEQELHTQKLQIELTESLLAQEAFRKKIDFLELENIELRNNLQTSEAANYDKTKTLESLRSALDGLGIQKRQRNGNRKKDEAPCNDTSLSSPLSSPAELPPTPPPLSNVSPAPTTEAIGHGESSTESGAGIVGTA
jgi:hypothetical protein